MFSQARLQRRVDRYLWIGCTGQAGMTTCSRVHRAGPATRGARLQGHPHPRHPRGRGSSRCGAEPTRRTRALALPSECLSETVGTASPEVSWLPTPWLGRGGQIGLRRLVPKNSDDPAWCRRSGVTRIVFGSGAAVGGAPGCALGPVPGTGGRRVNRSSPRSPPSPTCSTTCANNSTTCLTRNEPEWKRPARSCGRSEPPRTTSCCR